MELAPPFISHVHVYFRNAVLRFVILALFISIAGCRKKDDGEVDQQRPLKIRISGYLLDNFSAANEVLLSQITDLNLAFINPDTAGVFHPANGLRSVIEKAHFKEVRVYLSIGGAAAPAHLKTLLANNRTLVINNLIDFVEEYNFDGVDVDLEGDFIDENYPHFVTELADALTRSSKKITAALATWNGNSIHDSTLRRFDYINVMAYDKTGPWDPLNAGPHAPFEMAVDDVTYFMNSRSIDSRKILLGVPFYGYQFGTNVSSLTYEEIVRAYPEAETKDFVTTANNSTIYYNGIPTIERKVQYAKTSRLAGIMIWELQQDASGNKSLLNTINKKGR